MCIRDRNGRVEAVRVLLAAGADANKAKLGGLTPMYIAASNGHAETVRVLLEAGADSSY